MAFADPTRSIEQLALTPGMTVADFGAGTGYLAVAAAEAVGQGGKVYVVDIQDTVLTKARHYASSRHMDTLVFVHGDLEAPHGSTLADTSVDVVLCSNLLFQVSDRSAILREAYRVLVPGGRLVVIDWSDSYGGMGPQPEYVVPESVARAEAEAVGFRAIGELDAGSYHYGLVLRKNAAREAAPQTQTQQAP